jgi:hypothetical protein
LEHIHELLIEGNRIILYSFSVSLTNKWFKDNEDNIVISVIIYDSPSQCYYLTEFDTSNYIISDYRNWDDNELMILTVLNLLQEEYYCLDPSNTDA